MLVRGFVLNLKMTIVEPSRNPFIGLKETRHFDFTALVPLQLKTILKSPQSCHFLNKMTAILVGGSSINIELYEQLQCIKAQIFHSYGMTETVSHIALRRLNGKKKNTAFFPLEGVEIGVNSQSCLTIRGPVTNNELIQTNDKVEILPDKSFLWLGRNDNIAVSSSGKKIQLEKIESVFATLLSTVTDCYVNDVRFSVFLHSNKDSESHVYIAIEGYKIPRAIESEIREELSHLLTKDERPTRFFYVKWLPETITGKVDKKAIINNLENEGLLQ
jgi:O-succinylbenzoic acid--CoA ligase